MGMGFFSWETQDTNKSIANRFSKKPLFSVTMTDNKGNRWHEHNYEGYGEIQPNLTEDYEHEWVDKHPKDCPDQGFFYEEEWAEILDFKEKKPYTYDEIFKNRDSNTNID